MSYQQPHAPPPGHGPPPGWPPPKKRRKWPWIVAGIVVATIVGCLGVVVLLVGGTAMFVSDVHTDMDDNRAGKNAVAGEMNKPAVEGTFEFTVTDLVCGATPAGGASPAPPAQGQYCLVAVQVKNLGQAAASFATSSQMAYDQAGTQYPISPDAQEPGMAFRHIGPGSSVQGTLVFDVPQDARLTSIVLHEDLYSAGVRVPFA